MTKVVKVKPLPGYLTAAARARDSRYGTGHGIIYDDAHARPRRTGRGGADSSSHTRPNRHATGHTRATAIGLSRKKGRIPRRRNRECGNVNIRIVSGQDRERPLCTAVYEVPRRTTLALFPRRLARLTSVVPGACAVRSGPVFCVGRSSSHRVRSRHRARGKHRIFETGAAALLTYSPMSLTHSPLSAPSVPSAERL